MKSVINVNEAIYYVSEADMVKFIEANSDYDWNQLCDLCRDSKMFGEDGKTYYVGKISKASHNTEFSVEWINNFYDAHPFMQRIMFVFDD